MILLAQEVRVVLKDGAEPKVVLANGDRIRIVQATSPVAAAGSPPYIHTQSSPLDTWVINHNLGWNPIVSVLSAGGIEVEAEVVHVSTNQAQILFNSPVTGKALMR